MGAPVFGCVLMTAPLPTVRYAFYAFIATIPFETIDIGLERGVFSVSRISGYLFIVAAFLQPQVCFKRPPAIAWWFGAYVGAYLGSGFLHGMASAPLFTTRLMTYTQLLVLFSISCNLFQSCEVVKATFLAFGCACVVLSVLQVSGYSARIVAGTRVSALAENPNTLGTVLALGSLAL